jgi:hypothetical protein
MLRTAVGTVEGSVECPPDDVGRMLLALQRELLNDIQSRVREAREVGSDSHSHTTDLNETVEAEPQDDLTLRSHSDEGGDTAEGQRGGSPRR